MEKEIPLLKTIIMFLILLNFGGVLSMFYPTPLALSILFFSILLFILNKRYYISRKYISFSLIAFIVIGASIFINKVSVFDYKGIFNSLISSIFIFSSFKNNKEIVKYFIRACKIVIWLALINFILFIILPNLYTKAITANGNYEVFTFFFIFNDLGAPYQIAGINFSRNQGVFWEPGILQIIINILIYYYLFEEKKSLKSIFIPTFILLTTASTTGLFIFALLFTIKYLKEMDLKKIFILLAVGGLFIPILINDIEHKFKGDAKQSSQLRTYDALMGLYVISKYPLTGRGINEDKYLEEIKFSFVTIDNEKLTIERGNTNSLILLCLYFGIPLSIIILYKIYHQNLFEKKWLFFSIIIICLMSEPLITRMFFYLLFISSIKINRDKVPSTTKTISNSIIL